MIICFQKSICLLWVANFPRSYPWFRKPSHTFTGFHRWIHMCNQKDNRAFTRHIILFSIFKPCFSILDVVPFSELTQSLPNAVLIFNHENRGTLLDVVQGTMSTTYSSRMVNDNTYAHTPISCDIPVHMKCNYIISCLCHVTHIYTDAIWTISFMNYTHASFGKLYQSIYNFQLNHTNHVNILIHTYILSTCQYIRTHILTSNQLLPSMSFKLKQ